MDYVTIIIKINHDLNIKIELLVKSLDSLSAKKKKSLDSLYLIISLNLVLTSVHKKIIHDLTLLKWVIYFKKQDKLTVDKNLKISIIDIHVILNIIFQY